MKPGLGKKWKIKHFQFLIRTRIGGQLQFVKELSSKEFSKQNLIFFLLN
jgi:hypothetical protein